MTTSLEAAAEWGGTLHQEHVLLHVVLDDVGGGEHTQRLLHLSSWHSGWTLYSHALHNNELMNFEYNLDVHDL